MAYTPTIYRDNDPTTPLSAANLNKSEQGIKAAHDEIARVENKTDTSIASTVNATVANVLPVAVQQEVAKLNLQGVDEAVIIAKINEAIGKLPPAQLDTDAVKRVVTDTLTELKIVAIDENALAQRILAQIKVPGVDESLIDSKARAAVTAAIAELPRLYSYAEGETPTDLADVKPGSIGHTVENAKLWVYGTDSWVEVPTGGGGLQSMDWDGVNSRIQSALTTYGGTVDEKISTAVAAIKIPEIPELPKPEPLFNRIYRHGERKLAVPTYWWADSEYNSDSNWKFIFRNIDIVPFVLINPRSGAGDKAENDFVSHLKKLKSVGVPAIGYVRTVTDLANRTMRPVDDVLAEVAKYMEYYGRENIHGIFFDEVYNGWDDTYRAQEQMYLDIFRRARETYGDDFLIVANPGSPTTSYLMDVVDVIMCFEQNPATFKNSAMNLSPDWYKNINPGKLWVAIHDVASEAEARKILKTIEGLNIANVYLTTDTFNGVIGGENGQNNPWDNLPAAWLQDLQTDWMRHSLLPESVREYSGGAAGVGGQLIHIVRSQEEAADLPIGTLYAIVEKQGVRFIGTAGGNINANVLDAKVAGANAGDHIIVGINTKGVGTMTITPPDGFTRLVDGYWAGTQRSWLFSGVVKNPDTPLVFTASTGAEFGWAAVAVRGATEVVAGSFKSRADEPADSDTVVTAKAVEHAAGDLALGFAFERTSSAETTDQVTVSSGWEKLHYTEQSTNYQTVLVAGGGTGDLTVTYPHTQPLNGGGVQVVCRG